MSHSEPIQVVMFDMDGTLVDTMGALADLAGTLLAQEHAMPFSEARRLYLETSGVPFSQQLELISAGDVRNPGLAATFERHKKAICDAAAIDVGTQWVLEALRSSGLSVVLSSNSAQHYVDDFADRCPFRFDLVLGFGGGLAKGRPHVDRVCAALDVSPRAITFVGDSLRDAEIAASCGLRFVGRLGTFDRAHFSDRCPTVPLIDDLADVINVLAKMQRPARGSA